MTKLRTLFVNCSDHLVYIRVVLKHKATASSQSNMAKILKREESCTIYEYDNGYMLEVSGRDSGDDWVTSKVIYNKPEELINGLLELLKLPKS